MSFILDLFKDIIEIYFKIVVVQVVLSWLIHFKILQPSNKYAQKTVELLDKATTPAYNKIKSVVPTTFSGFDFAPFILLFILWFVAKLIISINQLIGSV